MLITILRRALGGLLATAMAAGATLAAVQPASAQQYSVPGAPGVADVSLVQGNVVIVRGDSGVQYGAAINTPMLPGDYISTAGYSRAEVQFDGVSALRLAGDTQVRMVNLTPGSREVQLASGTTELAELQGGDQSQIDTPTVSVRASQPGDYRVSVMPNGETLVTVRSGNATVFSQNGSQTLAPGSTLVAYGSYEGAQISFQPPIAYDGFDNFNQSRDQAIVASYNANPYVSPYMAGFTDFSNYGQWYNVPGYGESWAPSNQGNGWYPYSNGQWVWEPGYGYTWVGNEPWGYVPYHYGNWYYATAYNQWMWQPPSYQYQNSADSFTSAWLPALVTFFLTGGNTNAALNTLAFDASNPYGYGNIGWVPLAPGEQYTPWYAGFGANAAFPQTALSPVTNVTNVYNVYRNIRYIKIVKVIRVDRFRNGQFASATRIPVTQVVRHIAIVRGAVPIVPTHAVLAVKPATTTVRLSSRFEQPRFAAKAPAIVREASFTRQTEALHTAVAAKPRVEELPARTATVEQHPVYTPPVEHRTFHAPVQEMHPATAPQRVQTPVKTAPEHTMVPQQKFVPPAQRTTPERTTPERTTPERTAAPAPEHTMVPQQRFVPPTERTTPERTTPERTAAPAPERTVAPERTTAPQRFAPPEQRVAPERVTPQRTEAPAPVRQTPERTMTAPEQRAAPQKTAPAPERTFAPQREQRPATPASQQTAAPERKHPKATPSPGPIG